MAGRKFDEPKLRAKTCAQGSELNDTDRMGTSKVGSAANTGAGKSIPSLERTCSGEVSAHRSPSRPSTTPIIGIL